MPWKDTKMKKTSTTVTVKPLNESLAEQIYQRLKDKILSNRLIPSVNIRESELAEKFEVSRTPVREAIKALVNEGLIQRNGRFYEVVTLSHEEVRHVSEVREALERMAVCLFVNHAPDHAINELGEIIEQQEKAVAEQDRSKIIKLDRCFHLTIAKYTQNPFLYEQLVVVHDRVLLIHIKKKEITSTWDLGMIAEHERILDALLRRDVTVAEAEMRYHLSRVLYVHQQLQQSSNNE